MTEHRTFAAQAGFSLIELMIAIAILGVLVSLAAPSFSQMLRLQKVKALAYDLQDDIAFARSEAIKRNGVVTLTPKDTAASKDWAKGWDITTTTPAAATLKSQDAISGGVTGSGVNTLAFGSAGRPTVTTPITVGIQHADIPSSDYRCITVDFSGRTSTKTGSCS